MWEKYMWEKLKIELDLKLRLYIILNFWHLNQWICLEAHKNKITKDKNRENIPYLENMEVILIQKLK